MRGADFFTGLDRFIRRPMILVVDKEMMGFYRDEIYIAPAFDLTKLPKIDGNKNVIPLGVQHTYSDCLGALSTVYPEGDIPVILELTRDYLIQELLEKNGPDPQIAFKEFDSSTHYYHYDPSRHPAPPQLMSFDQAVQKVMERNEVTKEEATLYIKQLCKNPTLLPLELQKLERSALRFSDDSVYKGLVKLMPFSEEDYTKYKQKVPPHTYELQNLMLRVWTEGVLYCGYGGYTGGEVPISPELYAKSSIAQDLAKYKSLFIVEECVQPKPLQQPEHDITEGLI